MKRVFSVPQPSPEASIQEPEPEENSTSAPIIPPSPAIYVRQVTEQHQNAIARILSRVRSHPQETKEEKPE